MPTTDNFQMKLSDYQVLITNLPVRAQSFTTKRSTWLRFELQNAWLKSINDNLFKDNELLTLNRQDVFDTEVVKEKIIKIIYWGYPQGKRGKHFLNILKQFDQLEDICFILSKEKEITSAGYLQLTEKFKEIEGIGLSTYSKILYFFDIKIDYIPCIILDQRIINVIEQKRYSSLNNFVINSYNKEKKYPEYLNLINSLSQDLETQAENLEQFLFLFTNLKPITKSSNIT